MRSTLTLAAVLLTAALIQAGPVRGVIKDFSGSQCPGGRCPYPPALLTPAQNVKPLAAPTPIGSAVCGCGCEKAGCDCGQPAQATAPVTHAAARRQPVRNLFRALLGR